MFTRSPRCEKRWFSSLEHRLSRHGDSGVKTFRRTIRPTGASTPAQPIRAERLGPHRPGSESRVGTFPGNPSQRDARRRSSDEGLKRGAGCGRRSAPGWLLPCHRQLTGEQRYEHTRDPPSCAGLRPSADRPGKGPKSRRTRVVAAGCSPWNDNVQYYTSATSSSLAQLTFFMISRNTMVA
jgi:hypothetical protein